MHEWHLSDRVLRWGRRPLIMGIVNVTPDSFSDGGQHASTERAVAHGLELVRQGTDILDIGGESTRPGATPVSIEEELARVVPVVTELASQVAVPISVDTYKAEVARRCLAAGSRIVNDVTALTGDPAMPEVVAKAGAGVVLMHMQGNPQTMQQAPRYADVLVEIRGYLEARLQQLAAQGIAAERTVLDPGIGFGKTREHNLILLARLNELGNLGRPVCLGVSRKGFLGRLLDRPVERRLASSLAAACWAAAHSAAHILRVHDVEETLDAMKVIAAIAEQGTDLERSAGTTL